MKRYALPLAATAVLVTAPRLVIAYLGVDRLPMSQSTEAALLSLTGLASGAVLTLGAAYLMHALIDLKVYRAALAVCWALIMLAVAVLVSPTLAAGLSGLELAQQLSSPRWQWIYAVTAALAPELVAAGCMIARAGYAAASELAAEQAAELLELAAERNALAAQVRLAAAPSSVPCRNGCGWEGRSEMAERGHQRVCLARAA